MMDITDVLQKAFSWLAALEERLSREWRARGSKRILIAACVLGSAYLVLYGAVIRPPAAFPVYELVLVEDGAPLGVIASELKEGNVVRSALALRIAVSLFGAEREVRAGDYLFKEPKGTFAVARAITRGAYGLLPTRIRVMEGATVKEMARIYDTYLLRFDAADFEKRAKEHEGYLFPDTYFFLPNASERMVLEAMLQNFDAKTAGLAEEVAASEKSFADIVTMASLLEREANNTEDRRKIAGVLWNRLERDMPLQVDAAFLYTLGKSTFDLTTEDLQSDSPYNTYRYKGLPPTPIGSPSLDSIRAAINPEQHDYLFYLADRHHVTYYSKTYEEHLRKKTIYLGN